VRAAAYRELERQAAASRFNARASSLLANLDWISGRPEMAKTRLVHALEVDPRVTTVHERLGLIAMSVHDAGRALKEFDAEQRLGPDGGAGKLDLYRGRALEALGRHADAVRAYRHQIERHPEDPEAREALDRISAARPS